jgi:hypothetical protein
VYGWRAPLVARLFLAPLVSDDAVVGMRHDVPIASILLSRSQGADAPKVPARRLEKRAERDQP